MVPLIEQRSIILLVYCPSVQVKFKKCRQSGYLMGSGRSLTRSVFRLGMGPTIPAARQVVNHGHILVNGRKVTIPSYECKVGDVITVRDTDTSRKLVANYADYPGLFLPDYLEFDKDALKGRIKEMPPREAVCAPVNELLVVEYYSRKI